MRTCIRALASGLVWTLLATSCAAAPAKNTQKCVLFAAGDTVLGRWQHLLADTRRTEHMFKGLAAVVTEADLAFVNLECVLSDRGQMVDRGEFRPFPYRGRPAMVRILKELGIDIVSQANNHSGDYGPAALKDSLAVLNASGIVATGAGKDLADARRIRFADAGGLRTAWIAFDMQEARFAAREDLAGTLHAEHEDIARDIVPLIREARTQADLVVVTAHWGANWRTEPSQDIRVSAHALIDAGADLVLGHSSHVVHGMEVYRGRPILYDMGTFFIDSVSEPALRESMVFLIEFTADGVTGVRGKPVYLNAGMTRPADKARGSRIAADFIRHTRNLSPTAVIRLDDGEPVITLDPKDRRRPALAAADGVSGAFDFERAPSCVGATAMPPDFPAAPRATFVNGIRLEGASLPAEVTEGTAFITRFLFSADKAVPGPSVEVRVSLYLQNSALGAFSYRHEPGDWSYPTPRWRAGDKVYDVHLFRGPKTMRAGVYDAYLGLYQPGSEGYVRVKTVEGSDARGVFLGNVRIVPGDPSSKNFHIPGLVEYGLAGEKPV